MDFEITLIATSKQEGGILGSFSRQLAELAGEATLLNEVPPFYVESGHGFHFEAQRTYRVVLTEGTE